MLVGAGITLHQSLAAATARRRGIPARVIDLYSVKPLDVDLLVARCAPTGAAASWSRTTIRRAAWAKP